jgi:hypothetical protein
MVYTEVSGCDFFPWTSPGPENLNPSNPAMTPFDITVELSKEQVEHIVQEAMLGTFRDYNVAKVSFVIGTEEDRMGNTTGHYLRTAKVSLSNNAVQ